MLRSELISAAREVRRAIRQPSMLTLFRLPDQQITLEQMLEAFRDWIKTEASFGVPERRILDCLDLAELTQTSYWNQLLTPLTTRGSDPPSGAGLSKLRTTLREADLRIPKLIALLQHDVDISAQQESRSPSLPIVTLLLPEQPDEFSTSVRIIESLQSMTNFYEAFSTFAGVSGHKLAVLSCDCANYKSFDFTGSPQIIEAIKSLILTIWSRAIYFKERPQEEKTKHIVNSLPILEHIRELTNERKIPPEQGLTLRNLIIAGATKFIDSGAMIPEIEENSHFDPAVLLTVSPRLVVKRPGADAEAGASDIEAAEAGVSDIRHAEARAADVAELGERLRANLNGAAANAAAEMQAVSFEA